MNSQVILAVAALLQTAPPTPAPSASARVASVVVPPAAKPVAPPVIVDPSPAAKALALEIATLLNSETTTLAQFRKAYAQDMHKAVLANPEYQKMEQAFPGISNVILAAMKPVLERNIQSRLPALWQELSVIYAGALTEAEMRELLRFYRSPTGMWLVTSVIDGVDLSQVLTATMKDPERQLTDADLKTSIEKSVSEAVRRMTPEQMRELLRFGVSPVRPKLQALNPRLLEVGANFANADLSAAEQAALEKAITSAVAAFIGQAPAQRDQT